MNENEINDKIDARILALIRDGKTHFNQLWADEYLHQFRFRAIDRRLQALRKKAKIAYSRKAGWQILENEK